jgi:hypothetical protein
VRDVLTSRLKPPARACVPKQDAAGAWGVVDVGSTSLFIVSLVKSNALQPAGPVADNLLSPSQPSVCGRPAKPLPPFRCKLFSLSEPPLGPSPPHLYGLISRRSHTWPRALTSIS